ncbi:MAG TPA: large conductance mechanosensitive channel protein MscL [Tepidisphaeraceae bacterium]|nr:large conductance mechanosensitive channel protein MscL [Tepidisphaeraceae bacterium]
MFKRAVGVLKANANEFKEFAFKGNLIQLAIAVVLGGAFGDLIKSFVGNLFTPLLSVFGADPANKMAGYASWNWRGINFGLFLADLISFLIIALAIFLLMVKVVGALGRLTVKLKTDGTPSDPTDKECPYCLMKVPYKARRCGHCTSDISDTPGAPGAAPAVPIGPV